MAMAVRPLERTLRRVLAVSCGRHAIRLPSGDRGQGRPVPPIGRITVAVIALSMLINETG